MIPLKRWPRGAGPVEGLVVMFKATSLAKYVPIPGQRAVAANAKEDDPLVSIMTIVETLKRVFKAEPVFVVTKLDQVGLSVDVIGANEPGPKTNAGKWHTELCNFLCTKSTRLIFASLHADYKAEHRIYFPCAMATLHIIQSLFHVAQEKIVREEAEKKTKSFRWIPPTKRSHDDDEDGEGNKRLNGGGGFLDRISNISLALGMGSP